MKVSAHLPDHVRNPRGELFGGFTPTYVDFIALFAVSSRLERASGSNQVRIATASLRVDYFEPVVGPRFIIESRRERRRGRTHHVLARFFQDGELVVLASTTMRQIETSSVRPPTPECRPEADNSPIDGRTEPTDHPTEQGDRT